MSSAATAMQLNDLLPLVVAGGAMGGLAAGLSRVRIDRFGFRFDQASPINGGHWIAALAIPMAIGVAGAIAVLFAIAIADGKKLEPGNFNEIFLISISAAAGFGARTLLPALSAALEKQVAAIADQTETIRRATEEMGHLIEEIREQTREMQVRNVSADVIKKLMNVPAAGIEAENELKNQVEEALYDLRILLERDPGNYHADYKIGIILALRNKLDEAEAHLLALAAKVRNHSLYSDRIHDVMWNLICVRARRYTQAPKPRLLATIINELRELARSAPRAIPMIRSDEDLESVRTTEAYRKLEPTLDEIQARAR